VSTRRQAVGDQGQNGPVSVNRIAWITTVAICAIAAAILLASGYQGYAGVVAAVGVAAAINLT
jgi:hypothetical protein